MATGFPTAATDSHIVIAMPGVKPAIVNRPDHGLASLAKVVEQNLIVKEVAVDVVDVYYVRIDFPNPSDQFSGRFIGGQSVPVEKPCLKSVGCNAETIAHWHNAGSAFTDSVAAFAIGHIALPAGAHSQLTYLLHYPAGRCV